MLMLLFYAGNEAYACDTEDVVEIVPKVKLKKVPYLPHYVAGTLNYGGTPIPVIDLCKLISHRESSSSMHTRIIIFRSQGLYPNSDFSNNSGRQEESFTLMGLIAEKVTETKKIEGERFFKSGIEIPNFPYLKEFFIHEGQTIQLISLPLLLDHFVKLLKAPPKGVTYE